ncbi:Trp family transcriptional regulator [Patescibacteria group bacterium]
MDKFKKLTFELLTSKEKKVLQKRFEICKLLKTKLTYREIAKKIGISTTTVVKLNQRMKIRKGSQGLKPKKNKVENDANRTLPWVIG